MAKSAKEIAEERKAKVQEWRSLYDKIELEKRSATQEEDATLDRLQKEIDAIEKQQQRAEFIEKEEARKAQIEDLQRRSDGLGGTAEEVEARNAFVQYLRGGVGSLTSEQRGLLKFERREGEGQVTSTDAKGGYLVAKSLSDKVIVALKSKGGFLAEVNILPTSKGGEILIPMLNDTGARATIVGQAGRQLGRGDKSFTSASLVAYTYATPIIPVSFELLEDSEIDIVSLLADCISDSIYRAIIEDITIGDGNGKPQGILVGATKGVDAAVNAFTYDNLVDLETSVDEAYLINAKWMFNRKTLAVIKKWKDSTGAPIWQPAMDAKTPATILGYPYVINPFMPDIAASAKSIIFGDFKQFTLRQVNGIGIKRLDERLADELNVGFFGYARFDGKLMDAGTHPVKYLQHAAV